MFLNLKKLYGRPLGALDGPLGRVCDFYFDDLSWDVRYCVVDAGAWLPGRQILLPPRAFVPQVLRQAGTGSGPLDVGLTRGQIERSPAIEGHRPVSRLFEEECFRYFGWPAYWEAGGERASGDGARVPPAPSRTGRLRSTVALVGYRIAEVDGTLGTVAGFTLDARTWVIREVVVETGHWYAGKEIFLLPANITAIRFEDSTVSINLTKEDLAQTARHDVAQAGAGRL